MWCILLQVLDLNDPKLVQAIWKPEVTMVYVIISRHSPVQAYFSNAKEADFQYVTVPNLLVRIKPGGQIRYIINLSYTHLSRRWGQS